MNFEDIGTIIITSLFSSTTMAYIASKIFENTIEKTIEHKFKLIAQKHDIIWQNEIAYRRAQLEELYGPVYSMLKTSAMIYRLWIENKICEANMDVKKYFETNNNDIRKILISKMHLIDGGEMPPQLINFMTSAMIWNWYCAKSSDAAFPPQIQQLPEVRWPEEFEQYIYQKTETLKYRLDELYKKYTINGV